MIGAGAAAHLNGANSETDNLVQRVRNESPSARELDKIAAAHAAQSGIWHRLWLDEEAGVLWFLEYAASGDSGDSGAELSQIPLRSASCFRVLTLWLRLPAALAHKTAPYEDKDGLGAVLATTVDNDLLLRLHREEADGELTYMYYDPRPWLEELLPLRDDLAGGDVRALAIAWRADNETLSYTKTSNRPPMPGGLDEDELTPQLNALIRLLEEVP